METALVFKTKKQLNIALVGIRPLDQVTLKGYLRVLLSLDTDLNWLSANDSHIDLFMIHHEFQNAPSITKVLNMHPNAAVLYIDRVEVGDGHLNRNVLTLPLKQISELNHWLISSVAVLSGNQPSNKSANQLGNSTKAHTAIATNTPNNQSNPNNSPTNQININTSTQSTNTPSTAQANIVQTSTKVLPKAFIEMVECIHKRPKGSFELINQAQVIALIDTERQLIWPQSLFAKLSDELFVRPYQGKLPELSQSQDAYDWLWQLALKDYETLLPLMHFSKKYKLRYWAKPPLGSLRRDSLAVMTAISKEALSPAEIAGRAHVSLAATQKIILSLLFSGHLIADNYLDLHAILHASQQAIPTIPTQSVSTPSVDTSQISEPTQEKAPEKLGFLAKLRKKLGL